MIRTVLRGTVLIFAIQVLGASVGQAACRADRVLVRGDWGQASFKVTLADTPALRARGLMFVEQLGSLEGMWFIYEAPKRATFWMRNTLIPLDMLFASSDGTILKMHENAVPLDSTIIDGGPGVQFVLEINGGMASRLGIAPGDVMQHPSIGPDAVLPCETTSP